jgi:predicted metal-dependent HD superfamily phosphohydrolase
MHNNELFTGIKNHIFSLCKNDLPTQVVYHNFDHIADVVSAVEEIGRAEGVAESDLELLLIAAWFHDIGFINTIDNHEDSSKLFAETYLTKINYSKDKTASVLKLIEATRMPQTPKNKLEEIICDADLFHLGSENFTEKSNLLRSELAQLCDKYFTDLEWLNKNIDFLKNHNYFTNYAFSKLNSQKTANWLKLEKEIKKISAKIEEQNLKSKLKVEEQKRKKEKDERPDRGIETMFRVTLRNHIKLSDIADTKANILLSVSAIVLSIALSTLFPKLDSPKNEYLIYPTYLFLIVTVVTMVFSILSTRPKVTSGTFTKDDVLKKKVNLLFFGSFHKMPLQDFQEGMSEMMNDRDYLYKSLMQDLYFLGKVLDKKYRLLRIAYTVFMIGVVVSVISFIFALQFV